MLISNENWVPTTPVQCIPADTFITEQDVMAMLQSKNQTPLSLPVEVTLHKLVCEDPNITWATYTNC